jgi:hypothetical protein
MSTSAGPPLRVATPCVVVVRSTVISDGPPLYFQPAWRSFRPLYIGKVRC